jgi:hypothetical protein
MENPKYQWIAFVAGMLTILALIDLIYGVHLTKQTEHLTFTWIGLVLSSKILLVLYGILNKSYGIYLPASLIILGIGYVLYVKLTYDNTTQIRIENELKHKNII